MDIENNIKMIAYILLASNNFEKYIIFSTISTKSTGYQKKGILFSSLTSYVILLLLKIGAGKFY